MRVGAHICVHSRNREKCTHQLSLTLLLQLLQALSSFCVRSVVITLQLHSTTFCFCFCFPTGLSLDLLLLDPLHPGVGSLPGRCALQYTPQVLATRNHRTVCCCYSRSELQPSPLSNYTTRTATTEKNGQLDGGHVSLIYICAKTSTPMAAHARVRPVQHRVHLHMHEAQAAQAYGAWLVACDTRLRLRHIRVCRMT